MKLGHRIAFALVLATTAWPTFAAADHFWNCTKPDGTRYADASKCDKGDTAVKVMKGEPTAAYVQTPMVQAEATAGSNLDTGVCPTNATYCARPDYGVTDASPRTQAITQFMRKKQCEFLKKFPQRCAAHR
ncbi:MAG: hypothetical protein V4858_22135 [Pseudomonadota bacterium]